MQEEKIDILDESGDKKYFSQLPHYILNHSTAIDQALYWQMKRYSGEKGKCFATQETLMSKLGIGRKAYNKALNYLLSKGWIKFIGMTRGKTRPVKTYAICDIWKLNIEHYEEIQAERTVSFEVEIQAESNRDTGQKNSKIQAKRTIEEEPSSRRIIKNTISKDIGAKARNEDIDNLITSLKEKLDLQIIDGTIKENRQYAWLCLKKFGGLEIVDGLLKIASQDKFWRTKIAGFKTLYYNGVKIASLKREPNIVKIS